MKATERHCPGRLQSVLLGDLQLLPECGPGAPTLSSAAGVPANLHCSVIPSFREVSILEDLRPQQPPNSTRQKDLQCLHGPSPSPTSTSSTSVPHGERGGLREVAAAPTPDGGLSQGGLNEPRPIETSRITQQEMVVAEPRSSTVRPPWPSLDLLGQGQLQHCQGMGMLQWSAVFWLGSWHGAGPACQPLGRGSGGFKLGACLGCSSCLRGGGRRRSAGRWGATAPDRCPAGRTQPIWVGYRDHQTAWHSSGAGHAGDTAQLSTAPVLGALGPPCSPVQL